MIGAGSSGIASCQVLGARGIDFDCFEVGSEVGGNWGVPRVLPIASADQQRLVIRK